MHLREALTEELSRHHEDAPALTAYILMEVIDRFLRHNGEEEAADKLTSEHMP